LISLENVSFVYTPGGPFEKEALKDITLNIEKGEFYGLIGHTGSGKSTLVQLISGLLRPTSGKLLVDGIDVGDKKFKTYDLKGKVGLVFQYPEHQLFEETVYADVAFGPKNMNLSNEEVDLRVRRALDLVGISEDIYNQSPFELSGGQKRRVAIAGVLAMEPSVLILDEPTAGLDPAGRDDILEEIKKLHQKRNITVILVSHSMEDIAKTANRLIVMSDGSLAMCGTLREIFARNNELKEIGLNIPQISRVILRLRSHGINIRPDIYTVEDAKNEILKLLGGEINA